MSIVSWYIACRCILAKDILEKPHPLLQPHCLCSVSKLSFTPTFGISSYPLCRPVSPILRWSSVQCNSQQDIQPTDRLTKNPLSLPCHQGLIACFRKHLSRCALGARSSFYICYTAINLDHPVNYLMAMRPNPYQWQCHVCHGGPYLYVNTTRCTNILSNNLPCNHDFCRAYCKTDNDIPSPLSFAQFQPAGLSSSSSREHSIFTTPALKSSGRLTSHKHIYCPDSGLVPPPAGWPFQSHHPPESRRSCRLPLHSNDVQCGSRPSMAGWWRCGACREMNNPDLHTGRCWNCGHCGPCWCCTRY